MDNKNYTFDDFIRNWIYNPSDNVSFSRTRKPLLVELIETKGGGYILRSNLPIVLDTIPVEKDSIWAEAWSIRPCR